MNDVGLLSAQLRFESSAPLARLLPCSRGACSCACPLALPPCANCCRLPPAGAEDIKKHKWFRGLNWAALYNKQMPAPFVPELRDDDDHHYYATYPDSVEESGPLLDAKKQAMFDFWC